MTKQKKEVKKTKAELIIRVTKDPKSPAINAYVFSGTEALMKQDITNDFIATIIGMWAGNVQTVETNDGKTYTISVQEIPTKKESKIIKSS